MISPIKLKTPEGIAKINSNGIAPQPNPSKPKGKKKEENESQELVVISPAERPHTHPNQSLKGIKSSEEMKKLSLSSNIPSEQECHDDSQSTITNIKQESTYKAQSKHEMKGSNKTHSANTKNTRDTRDTREKQREYRNINNSNHSNHSNNSNHSRNNHEQRIAVPQNSIPINVTNSEIHVIQQSVRRDRVDVYGVSIVSGSHRHCISFKDQVTGKPLASVKLVASYKKYNADVSTATGCACRLI